LPASFSREFGRGFGPPERNLICQERLDFWPGKCSTSFVDFAVRVLGWQRGFACGAARTAMVLGRVAF
jgi:hypothetical protein